MRLNWLALTARFAAASLAALPALNAPAGQTSVNVMVTATLIPSSGVCNTVNGGTAVGVTCGGSGGPIPTPPAPSPSPGVAPAPAPSPVASTPSAQLVPLGLGSTSGPSPDDLRYVGRVALAGGGFALYSASAEITSWRVVSLDNGNYVELTIAW
jgi:hypothetical protein